jgi:L-fucose isomerase-like protein
MTFLRFHAAAGKDMTVEQTTCDSLNTFTELVFTGFTRVADILTNERDRSEVYNVGIFHHLMARPDLILTSGSV